MKRINYILAIAVLLVFISGVLVRKKLNLYFIKSIALVSLNQCPVILPINKISKELLYSYSWGSGITRSCIAYFDLLQRKEEVLNITEGQSLGYIKEDLIFKKVSDNKIEVYTAKIKVEGGDFSKLSIEKDKQFGTIKVIENKPVFEAENKK